MLNQLNLHFINHCNYKCVYCFADKTIDSYPDLNSLLKWIDTISDYFKKNKITNPRINLVGGEPLLYNEIIPLIKYIHSKGIRVSLVTNGSLLTNEFLSEVGEYLDMIGISVDTLEKETAIKLGRCNMNKETLSLEKLVMICKKIKILNIKLKINIVVSKFNFRENFSNFLNKVKAERVKFLELYIVDEMNKESVEYKLSKEEYNEFCSKHSMCKNILKENNEKFDGGYIMIDYKGDLIVNHSNKHIYCGNIEIENFSILAKKALKVVKIENYSLREAK